MKPIETVYGGYKFRSRLEARWAVFFDALHIAYRYEAEGYDLDGIWYLPDFWLPELNCWVEVKAKWPTKEEMQKAKFLSWASGKNVYIFFGDVWMQDMFAGRGIYGFPGTKITVSGESTKEEFSVMLPLACMGLFVGLHELGLQLSMDLTPVDLIQYMLYFEWLQTGSCSLDTMMEIIEAQRTELPLLAQQLEQKTDSLVAVLAALPDLGAIASFHVHLLDAGTQWMSCTYCHRSCIGIGRRDFQCPFCKKHYQNDEKSLLAAYTMARQARFDGKDRFPWQK